ncbi:hypothetical protein [Zavarzinella formosa]|uniref:hypothetical protein n=1 Tax=Zavarzinella formosa TaxID=360055 RepID=UPI00031A04AA|nr:hypothetical protein [Zavarzinella formosa]
MTEVIRIATGVGTPLALLGLISALIYFAYVKKAKAKSEELSHLPKEDRAKAVDEYLTRYGITAEDLPVPEKVSLIKDEMGKRHELALTYVKTAAIVTVIMFALAVVAYLFAPVSPVVANEKTDDLNKAAPSTTNDVNKAAPSTTNDVNKAAPAKADMEAALKIDSASVTNKGEIDVLIRNTGSSLAAIHRVQITVTKDHKEKLAPFIQGIGLDLPVDSLAEGQSNQVTTAITIGHGKAERILINPKTLRLLTLKITFFYNDSKSVSTDVNFNIGD